MQFGENELFVCFVRKMKPRACCLLISVCTPLGYTPYRLKMRECIHEVQSKHQGAMLSLLLNCRLRFNSGFMFWTIDVGQTSGGWGRKILSLMPAWAFNKISPPHRIENKRWNVTQREELSLVLSAASMFTLWGLFSGFVIKTGPHTAWADYSQTNGVN